MKKNPLLFIVITFLFLTHCKKSKNDVTNTALKQKKASLSLKIDTLNNNVFYLLNVVTTNCKKIDTIFQHHIDESLSHKLILKNNRLLYEYVMARPVFFKSVYFNSANVAVIDSVIQGTFIFETSDYKIAKTLNKTSVCEFDLTKIID